MIQTIRLYIEYLRNAAIWVYIGYSAGEGGVLTWIPWISFTIVFLALISDIVFRPDNTEEEG